MQRSKQLLISLAIDPQSQLLWPAVGPNLIKQRFHRLLIVMLAGKMQQSIPFFVTNVNNPDILLEADQGIDFPGNCGLGENSRGFLE